jgi:CheY-like chemotaxis protein
MGGTGIDLRSETGRGSTFSFAVPVEVKQGAGPDTTDSGAFSGLRVLLVDDNSSSYMQLEETLNQWSADVTVVNRARIMLERLRSTAQRGSPFDLVLIDHSLPDMTSAEILRAIRTDTATSSTYVVLLTALAFDPDQAGDDTIEPDACIAKPVRQDMLRRALHAARSPASAAAPGAQLAGAGNAGVGLIMLGLDVLVVDDNAVNREVAVAMLEGAVCKVAVAEDGRTAVSRGLARRFDAILMDCQMPGMDGYQATAAIRLGESGRGTEPTPIVALTANALARDRDRCMAAGMTSFLSKPFTPAQLAEVLRPIAEKRGTLQTQAPAAKTPTQEASPATASRETSAGSGVRAPAAREPVLTESAVVDMLEPLFEPASGAASAAPASPASSDVLDREQIQAVLGLGKPAVFERLCELLHQSAPAALQTIDAALATGDLAKVASTAHSLKSSCANLGGRQLAAQLERCETAARESGDLDRVRSLAAGLQQNYAAFAAALAHEYPRKTA